MLLAEERIGQRRANGMRTIRSGKRSCVLSLARSSQSHCVFGSFRSPLNGISSSVKLRHTDAARSVRSLVCIFSESDIRLNNGFGRFPHPEQIRNKRRLAIAGGFHARSRCGRDSRRIRSGHDSLHDGPGLAAQAMSISYYTTSAVSITMAIRFVSTVEAVSGRPPLTRPQSSNCATVIAGRDKWRHARGDCVVWCVIRRTFVGASSSPHCNELVGVQRRPSFCRASRSVRMLLQCAFQN